MRLNRSVEIILYLFVISLVFFHRHNLFFWDTIQFAGRHGGWFYEQGFDSIFLPQEYDSGHPTFFGIYIALMWKAFGKSLAVAHLSMLPFIFLIYWNLRSIAQHYLKEKYCVLLVAWTACPFFLGHLTLVSPDLVLIAGFFMLIKGFISENKRWLILGSIFLGLISIRGFILLSAFLAFVFIRSIRNRKPLRAIITNAMPYLLGVVLFFAYQLAHYFHHDWIGYHDDSPWAPSFAMENMVGLTKNTVVFIWRLLDHGMFIAWFVLIFSWRQSISFQLNLLLLTILGALFIVTVPYSGLVNHRYFLPIHFLVILSACWSLRDKNSIYSWVFCFLLFLGNFIIYPDKIAKGWDATAAHFPYYELERRASNWIVGNDMAYNSIGTAFPLRGPRKHLDSQSRSEGYKEYDLNSDRYILYSNIMNDFSDSELEELSQWNILWEKKKRGVKMILYENPSY